MKGAEPPVASASELPMHRLLGGRTPDSGREQSEAETIVSAVSTRPGLATGPPW